MLSRVDIFNETYSSNILIEPFDDKSVQPASYDLHLWDEFITTTGRQVRADGLYTIRPGEFILGATREALRLPLNIAAELTGKSSIGRQGIIVHSTAGHVDPGWNGRLTLEIANISSSLYTLEAGMAICQLIFFYLHSPITVGYTGKFQNSMRPYKYGRED